MSSRKPIGTGERLSAQAIEGFLLHVFTFSRMTVIAMKALGPAGFSLTKHRILGFATVAPGITVGELVRRMRVTPQNVHQPLRRLIDEGYVVAKIGVEDRRHKRLFATRKGSRQYRRVLAEQIATLEEAFRAAGPDAARSFLEVHRLLVEPGDRQWIEHVARAIGKEHQGD
ncbi:MAG TPA: MarR family winged helix-turn-helix transcriptional regulator [Burkholderiales bacterium]|jgi:DNA-binding MarR family transcriptional regulator|nr:MarR family winged helix-turn-helix transcriptional regulator [Burkholderiales bacterium]